MDQIAAIGITGPNMNHQVRKTTSANIPDPARGHGANGRGQNTGLCSHFILMLCGFQEAQEKSQYFPVPKEKALQVSVPRAVTRDYDEEEQGYDSEKGEEEDEQRSESDSVSSLRDQEEVERDERQVSRRSKLNGDDRHQEDMEMSD
ncbi:hypothetical protein GOODEAATRI_030878 [Goodea atripinnis]|uniref:Uncharacterized protein n=1 Tax=Goodea atripinnis TaxID=208336 RepID=A0ABV0MM51_9TELE